MKNVLVIGAAGQIGSELVPALRAEGYSVVAGLSRTPLPVEMAGAGPSERIDILDGAPSHRYHLQLGGASFGKSRSHAACGVERRRERSHQRAGSGEKRTLCGLYAEFHRGVRPRKSA